LNLLNTNYEQFNEVSAMRSQKSAQSLARPKYEQMFINKLAYEWKNIYR